MPTDVDAPRGGRAEIIRALDSGRIWEQAPNRLPAPFIFDATEGPIIQLQDDSALICVYGRTVEAKTEALWSIRLRVRPGHDGIDLLPAPGT